MRRTCSSLRGSAPLNARRHGSTLAAARIRAFALVAASVLAGCHSFQPAELGELAPGQEVRARVTGAYADSLDTILFRDSRIFEGRVVEDRGGTVLVEIPVQQEFQGMDFRSFGQRVEIPDAAFVEVELKQLDRGRTLVAAAAGAAVVGAVVVAQLSGDSGGSTGPGGGGPQDAWIPAVLLRLGVPW